MTSQVVTRLSYNFGDPVELSVLLPTGLRPGARTLLLERLRLSRLYKTGSNGSPLPSPRAAGNSMILLLDSSFDSSLRQSVPLWPYWQRPHCHSGIYTYLSVWVPTAGGKRQVLYSLDCYRHAAEFQGRLYNKTRNKEDCQWQTGFDGLRWHFRGSLAFTINDLIHIRYFNVI